MSPTSHRRHRLQAAQKLLAEHGLAQSQRRFRGRVAVGDNTIPASARLRAALQQLGPVLSLFGRYLASRVDLLPYKDCLELSTTGELRSPTPSLAIRSLIETELGRPSTELLSILEEQPFRCGLLYQWHRAQLSNDGEEVVLKVLRPEVEARVAEDLELLPLLAALHLGGQDHNSLDLADAVAGFPGVLKLQLDLRHEQAMLGELATEVAGFDGLLVPQCIDRLCSQRLLTYDRPSGKTIDQMLVSPAPNVAAEGSDALPADKGCEQRSELARRLCLAWLQQSLLEAICLEGPLGDHLLVGDDHRFVVTGGGMVKTAAAARDNLLDYLVAARRQEPDRACSCLLRETTAGRNAIGDEQLRLRLRQAEPFREGGWSDQFAGQRLADTLYVHWRLCRRAGYRPSPTLLAFWRGLFDLEQTARRLAPRTDALAEGLDDLRVVAAAVRLRRAAGPAALKRGAEQLLPVLDSLRDRFDELVQGVTRSEPRSAAAAEADDNNGGVSWLGVGGILAAMAALAMIINRLGLTGLDHRWVDGAGALGFASLAALLLSHLIRSRG